MTNLSPKMIKAINQIRDSRYTKPHKATESALMKRGLIEMDSHGYLKITPAAFPFLKPGTPHTAQPFVRYFIEGVDKTRHDGTYAWIWKVWRVVDGKPERAGNDLKYRFESVEGARWDWHHKGFHAETSSQAKRIAKAALGESFAGFIN
jgi:hypothetical protein